MPLAMDNGAVDIVGNARGLEKYKNTACPGETGVEGGGWGV